MLPSRFNLTCFAFYIQAFIKIAHPSGPCLAKYVHFDGKFGLGLGTKKRPAIYVLAGLFCFFTSALRGACDNR